MQFLKRS